MVIDSSALVAILLSESDAENLKAAVYAAPVRVIGAPSYLETAMVLIGRVGPPGRQALDDFVDGVAADVAPFTPSQARRAIEAFLRYGKGRDSAGLNFGDCCSYALAAETGLPLLFKGGDFFPYRHPLRACAVNAETHLPRHGHGNPAAGVALPLPQPGPTDPAPVTIATSPGKSSIRTSSRLALSTMAAADRRRSASYAPRLPPASGSAPPGTPAATLSAPDPPIVAGRSSADFVPRRKRANSEPTKPAAPPGIRNITAIRITP